MGKSLTNVILGSGSPRRSELLKQMGIDFRVIVSSIDETFSPDIDPQKVPEYLAQKKAIDITLNSEIKPEELLITVDTIVITKDQILNKPSDTNEAIEMLKILAGKTHQVISGVCLSKDNSKITFSESTSVLFSELTKEEIEFYVRQYNPLDKAGAYGIQDWIGKIGIKKINGCYYNVVGLPTQRLWREIKNYFPLSEFGERMK